MEEPTFVPFAKNQLISASFVPARQCTRRSLRHVYVTTLSRPLPLRPNSTIQFASGEREREGERELEREREMHCIRIFCICTTYLSVAVKPINPRKGDYLSIHALLSTDQRSYLILHRFTQTHIAYDPLYRTNCKTVGLHMACWSHSWISSDCTVDHHSSIIHVYISPNSKQPFSKFLAECKNSEVLHFKKWSSFEYSSDWGTE